MGLDSYGLLWAQQLLELHGASLPNDHRDPWSNPQQDVHLPAAISTLPVVLHLTLSIGQGLLLHQKS